MRGVGEAAVVCWLGMCFGVMSLIFVEVANFGALGSIYKRGASDTLHQMGLFTSRSNLMQA